MSPGRKPSRSPASTAGRDSTMRSTRPCRQHRHGLRHGEVGLARAGRADAEHHLVNDRAAPCIRPGPASAARPSRGGCGSPAGPTERQARSASTRCVRWSCEWRHPRRRSRPPGRRSAAAARARQGPTAPPPPVAGSPLMDTRLPRQASRTPSPCSSRLKGCRSWSPIEQRQQRIVVELHRSRRGWEGRAGLVTARAGAISCQARARAPLPGIQ